MPERFEFHAPLETADERAVRAEFIARLRHRFFGWLEKPTEVFLLGRDDSQHLVWAHAEHLLMTDLSSTDLLFVYFAGPRAGERVILSVSKSARAAVYGISLPTTEIAMRPGEVLATLHGFYAEITKMGVPCIVAAGAELELNASSIEETMRSASDLGSLVSFICCTKQDADKARGFKRVDESGSVVILRRTEGA